MGTAQGVDYSTARPSPAGLAAAGKRFAIRYVSLSTSGKNLTVAEQRALWDAGVLTVLVWEGSSQGALGGYTQGVADAQNASRQAHALGAPADVVIYFAVDFNPTAAQLSTIANYFHGVLSVLPFARVGCYGGLRTVSEAKRLGWAAFLWQTYAWSGGVWLPAAQLRQTLNGVNVAGGDTDLDVALTDYIGQYGPSGAIHNWEDWDMDPKQISQLEDVWNIEHAMANGLDTAPQHAVGGTVDLTQYYDRVARAVIAQEGAALSASTLSSTDVAAIATAVTQALTARLEAVFALLDKGGAQPADSGAPSVG
jgi:hypothetical protein